jgi:hypothetical protein
MAIVTFEVDQQALADAAAGGGGGVIPEGQYILRYTEAKFEAPTQQGKAPKLVLKCEIVWSESGGSLGKKVTRRLHMTPKAIPYFTIPFLQAAGVPVQQDPRGGIAFDPDLIVGTQTKCVCSHSKGDQRTFEDWASDEPVVTQAGVQGVGSPMPANPPQAGTGQPPWQHPQQAPPQAGQFPVAQQPPASQQAPQPMQAAPPQWASPGAPMQASPQQPQQGFPPQQPPQPPQGQGNPWGQLPPRGQG